jgi:hypothetical protein
MIQVGAGETDRAFVTLKCDPGVRAKILAALPALGLAMRDEDLDLVHHKRYLTNGTRTVPGTKCILIH